MLTNMSSSSSFFLKKINNSVKFVLLFHGFVPCTCTVAVQIMGDSLERYDRERVKDPPP
jgi:hypothetical protein